MKKQSMDRPHRVLEKKLHELEMRFTDLFFPPANSDNSWRNPAADQERLSKEIEARVEFLKNLLSIEKECHLHGKLPSHLVKLEERFEGLNTAFHDWMEGADSPKEQVPAADSVECSCTRSCFSGEDEEEEGEEDVKEEEEKEKEKDREEEDSGIGESDCFELEITEDTRASEVKRSDEEKTAGDQKEPRRYNRPNFRLLSRILALVVTAAAVSVGVTALISEVLGGFHDDVFLVPT
jgi:hypothetical protein